MNDTGDPPDRKEDYEKIPLHSRIPQTLKDLLSAGAVVGLFLFSLYLYSHVWPPLVVVESGSMMHEEDSSIGVIDTGDLIVVKKEKCGDIRTWAEASRDGYSTYGGYGDVIIYLKNGVKGTPIIHRAILWVEYNRSSDSYSAPELGPQRGGWVSVPNLRDERTGEEIVVDLDALLTRQRTSGLEPVSGFITMGDNNNPDYDQKGFHGGLTDPYGRPVQPVKCEWIMGVSRGEIPWYGTLKLVTSGNPNPIPPSSASSLVVSLVIILGIPMAIDLKNALRAAREAEEAGEYASEEREEGEGGGEIEDEKQPEKR